MCNALQAGLSSSLLKLLNMLRAVGPKTLQLSCTQQACIADRQSSYIQTDLQPV